MGIRSATELAQQLTRGQAGEEIAKALAKELSGRGGKPVRFLEREDLGTAARLELAENHGRQEHRVLWRPGFPAVEHLQVHELYHLHMILGARDQQSNQLFTSTEDHKAAFRTSVLPTLRKLRNEGVAEEAAEHYIAALFKGFLLQIYNAPLDLFIEFDMHREHPGIRPYQFLSLGRMVQEAVQACTDPQALNAAPPAVASASRVYNATHAMLLKELYGIDRMADLKASAKEVQLATKLYDEFKEYRADRQPGEEYEVVQHWAGDLQLEAFFALVPERPAAPAGTSLEEQLRGIEADPIGDFATDPEAAQQMRTFQEKAREQGANMAVVMYMVDALKHFKGMDHAAIKKAAFEIAMLGTQGIHPEKQGYKLASVSGTTFSGFHLLAYYYISFKLVLPELLPELQLPYDAEYAMAEQLYTATP
jgi:hypothetical protein